MMNNNSDRQAAPMHDGLVAFPSPSHSPTSPPVSLASTVTHRETPRAAAAFSDYALLGPDRSLAKLKEHLDQIKPKSSPKLATLKYWSSAFHWQDRVRQFDAQEAEKRRKKRQQELEKMDEEHSLIGRTHLLRSITAMEPFLKPHVEKKVGEDGKVVEIHTYVDAPFPSLVSLFKFSAELERLARGAATSRLEGDITVMVQPKEYIGIDEDEEGSVE